MKYDADKLADIKNAIEHIENAADEVAYFDRGIKDLMRQREEALERLSEAEERLGALVAGSIKAKGGRRGNN